MAQDDKGVSGFVWTRFGVEAGEKISAIIDRKETERVANGGVFLWGIGNNIGPSISQLVRNCSPEVLFSPIASSPRSCDVEPEDIFAWTEAETLDGEPFEIPSGSIVTSRGGSSKTTHYALVCHSDFPLSLRERGESVYAGALRNFLSGRRVGSSQVTCVVEGGRHPLGREYQVSLRIKLAAPYFVRLRMPVSIPKPIQAQLLNSGTRDRGMQKLNNLMSNSRQNSQRRNIFSYKNNDRQAALSLR